MASPNTASPPISKFRFLSEKGVPQEGPLEWARAQIAIDCPAGSLAAARLSRNDTPLPLSERVVNDSVELVADWPLSGAGHYELQLELDGELIEVSRWTVEPTKLSAEAFRDLLDDLENRLPVTIALALQKLGAFTGFRLMQPTGASSVAEEIARLRRAVTKTGAGPGLALILREIAQDPHQVLADVEMWVPAEQARRVSAAGLVRAVSFESNTTSPGVPDRLPDNRVEATVDVYENRLLKAFIDQVELRLRRLRSFLAAGHSDFPTHELDALERELGAARSQAPFLLEVGQLGQAPTNVTMVLVKKPAYRKLLEAFLDFRSRTAVRLNEPALESPLENLPSLYETWGVLHAILAILELGVENGYRIKRSELFRHGPVGSWIEVLPKGRPAVTLERSSDDSTVSVVPQRTYSAAGNDLKSISYPQRPDLAVEVVRPQNPTAVYLLDPKYKLESENDAPSDGKPKKADIDKMHAYRDAIRDEQDRRIVKFAGILYPGPQQVFTPGLAALSAVPGGTGLMDQLRQVLAPALA
jgi:PD-(D/E)XK nuclease superfamily/Domain of unknown function (DUF2357)